MILDRLRRKKKEKAPPISRGDFLKIIPVPNPKVKLEKDESNNIILILRREEPKEEKEEGQEEKPERRPRRRSILPAPAPQARQKKIHLDTVGSIVWELCDGKRTTKDIAEQLRTKYKMLPSEAEISLNSYFNELAKRGLVAFLIPEEVASKFSKKETKEEKKQPTKQ